MGLEFDLLAEEISKLQRFVENVLIDGNQRRREDGWIAARQRMVVMSRGEDQDVFVISVLNRAGIAVAWARIAFVPRALLTIGL